VATNVTGLLYCVHAALPSMVERGRGHVIVIGSVAALYPIPSASYAATKGAGHSFVQSLRVELQGSGVRVTEVSPGRVNTEFVNRANPGRPLPGPQPDPESLLQAADVADAVLYAATARDGVQVSHIELVSGCQVIGGSRFVTQEEREQHS
jgi:NADP-dependent 3-hydroxy acid dehydrogenase YdfG